MASRYELNGAAILGVYQRAILTEVKENPIYEDGKAIGKIDGYKVDVVPITNFEKITVKIPGLEIPPELPEYLRKNLERGTLVWVTFENLSATLYQDFATKALKVSAKADNMKVLKLQTSSETGTKKVRIIILFLLQIFLLGLWFVIEYFFADSLKKSHY